MKRDLKFYLDTSVYGGVFDEEFSEDSKRLIKAFSENKFYIQISEIVIAEIEDKGTPEQVKKLFRDLPPHRIQPIYLTSDVVKLQQAYLDQKIVTPKSKNDAAHVALATAYRADAIISWNFKHIVRFDRMKLFNQVNLSQGYGFLSIVSPKEVYFEE